MGKREGKVVSMGTIPEKKNQPSRTEDSRGCPSVIQACRSYEERFSEGVRMWMRAGEKARLRTPLRHHVIFDGPRVGQATCTSRSNEGAKRLVL